MSNTPITDRVYGREKATYEGGRWVSYAPAEEREPISTRTPVEWAACVLRMLAHADSCTEYREFDPPLLMVCTHLGMHQLVHVVAEGKAPGGTALFFSARSPLPEGGASGFSFIHGAQEHFTPMQETN